MSENENRCTSCAGAGYFDEFTSMRGHWTRECKPCGGTGNAQDDDYEPPERDEIDMFDDMDKAADEYERRLWGDA